MNKYLVIYEPGERNWSAFSPDVPGCIATGKDRKETEQNFQEALTLHLELLAGDGDEIPQPSGIVAGYVTVPEFGSSAFPPSVDVSKTKQTVPTF